MMLSAGLPGRPTSTGHQPWDQGATWVFRGYSQAAAGGPKGVHAARATVHTHTYPSFLHCCATLVACWHGICDLVRVGQRSRFSKTFGTTVLIVFLHSEDDLNSKKVSPFFLFPTFSVHRSRERWAYMPTFHCHTEPAALVHFSIMKQECLPRDDR